MPGEAARQPGPAPKLKTVSMRNSRNKTAKREVAAASLAPPIAIVWLIAQRHWELLAASIREVAVFHSTVEELLPHARQLPFTAIADPDKRLYTEFGVESAPRALLDPRAWVPVLRGVTRSLVKVVRREQPSPALNPHGGRFGLPADFLIASDGKVIACKYGSHAYDQWSVDEILGLARERAILKDDPTPCRFDEGRAST